MTLTDAQRARALARYRNLRGRGGVRVGFKQLGPTVEAKNPQELEEATDEALVQQTEKQPES